MLTLQVTQSLNVLGGRLAKFAVPGIYRGLGDVVLSRDVIDRRQPCFAQNLYYLTFGEVHFLHSYP